MKKINVKNNKGFTLVEALVAVSILMVAVVSPMTIAQRGLSSAVFSKEQMVASYLAQDAIEYIKNKRDGLGIVSDTAPQYWFPSICGANACDIDTTSDGGIVAKPWTSYENNLLKVKKDADGNFISFGHSASGVPSNFSRKIEAVGTAGMADEIKVTVTVYWKGGKESVEVSAFLYNYWGNTITSTP